VIWEPVLPTDFAAPSTAALARIPDPGGTWKMTKNIVVYSQHG
jgi:hypothetical protein